MPSETEKYSHESASGRTQELRDQLLSLAGGDQPGTADSLKSDGQSSEHNGRMANVPYLRPADDDAVAECNHRIANNLAIIACMVREATAKLKTDPHRTMTLQFQCSPIFRPYRAARPN